MTDVKRVMDEAKRAREEAEIAAQRAEAMEAQAATAQQHAQDERIARQRSWAQQTVDAYDADLSTAEGAVQSAQTHFEEVAADDLSSALKAYYAWGQAASRHYALQVRIGIAAPLVEFDASPAEAIVLPPFSQAIDQAIQQRLASLSDQARDETAAELQRLFSDAASVEPPRS